MPTQWPGAPATITVTQEVYKDLIAIVERAERVAPDRKFTYSDVVQYLLEDISGTPDLLAKQGELMAGKV